MTHTSFYGSSLLAIVVVFWGCSDDTGGSGTGAAGAGAAAAGGSTGATGGTGGSAGAGNVGGDGEGGCPQYDTFCDCTCGDQVVDGSQCGGCQPPETPCIPGVGGGGGAGGEMEWECVVTGRLCGC